LESYPPINFYHHLIFSNIMTPEQLLADFLSVGAENKKKVAEDRYKYIDVPGMTFLKAKALPDADNGIEGTVIRVDLKSGENEFTYYTNAFSEEYFEKFERGTIVNVEAKRWYDADGKPQYEGRTTAWTIDSISVAPVKAGSPITI
jgi:hypothetical protein